MIKEAVIIGTVFAYDQGVCIGKFAYNSVRACIRHGTAVIKESGVDKIYSVDVSDKDLFVHYAKRVV